MNPVGSISRNVDIIITNIEHIEDNIVYDRKNKEFIPLKDKKDLETKYKSAEFVTGSEIFSAYEAFIDENSEKIAPDKLKILDLSLENRISHLKGQLTGVTGFFRTMFFAHWTDDTISTFQHLQILDRFIKEKVSKAQTPHTDPDKAGRLKETQRELPAPIAPLVEKPSEPASHQYDDESSSTEPLSDASDSESNVTAQPAAPQVATPKGPPPPPPPLKGAKIQEVHIPGEPAKEPSFNRNLDKTKGNVQTATEMLDIQRYTTDLDTALRNAGDDLKEYNTSKSNLEESVQVRLKDAEKALKDRSDALKFLMTAKRNEGVIFELKVNKRTGEIKKVPLYEDGKFKQRNAEREKRKQPPLNEKYLISKAIEQNQTSIQQLEEEVAREQKKEKELIERMTTLESKYRPLFDRKKLPKMDLDKTTMELLQDLLKKKELKLHQWHSAYQHRETFLLGKEKQVKLEPVKTQPKEDLEPEWNDLKSLNAADMAFFAKADDIALFLIAPEKYTTDPDLVKKYKEYSKE